MELHEEAERWSLKFAQAQIQMIQIDFRLALLLAEGSDHAWLTIGSPCTLKDGAREVSLVPEQAESLAPILALFNAAATGMSIEKSGRLILSLGDSILNVAPDEAYEAWELACSIGGANYLLVCSPGGKIALFHDADKVPR